MALPRTPKSIYREINKFFWDNTLPDNVKFHWLDNGVVLEGIMDMRKDLGGVVIRRDQADIYLNRVLEDSDRLLRFVIGHECIHIAHPSERHGSKKWKEAVRILAAKGFFERYF